MISYPGWGGSELCVSRGKFLCIRFVVVYFAYFAHGGDFVNFEVPYQENELIISDIPCRLLRYHTDINKKSKKFGIGLT